MRVNILSQLPEFLWDKINFTPRFLKSSDGTLGIDYNKLYFDEEGKAWDRDTGKPYTRNLEETGPFDAQLISSRIGPHQHRVILDLDMECELIQSSTPGRYHLYLNKILEEEQMDTLITTLVQVGILEDGIKKLQWDIDKELTLRLPWVKKGDDRSCRQRQQHHNDVKNLALKNMDPVSIDVSDIDDLFME